MKPETQIAQENIGLLNEIPEEKDFAFKIQEKICIEHKATLQRFLEFLNYCLSELIIPKNILKVFEIKITDIKQAIKLYNEAGI